MRPPVIKQDKSNHANYGVVLFVAFSAAALFTPYKAYALEIGLVLSGIVEAAFEVYQRYSKSGEPSNADWLAGFLGSTAAAAACYIGKQIN